MQLQVLGPLQVSSGGRVWSPGGPKERRLLAILVLHLGEVVSVDALAEALWEGNPPRSAVKTLQVYVTRLRAALAAGHLDGDLVRTVGRGYRLALTGGCRRRVRVRGPGPPGPPGPGRRHAAGGRAASG